MRTLLVTLITCLFVLPVQAKYSGGTGDPNNPYQIATAEDLMLLGETPEDYDKHFVLTADIDLDPNLPGGKVFDRAVIAPAGVTPFAGMFDGKGHTISHLTIRGNNCLGLFGELKTEDWDPYRARIKNVGIVDVSITGSGDSVGGLVGHVGSNRYGTIDTSYSSGSVSGRNNVGGLVGCNNLRGQVSQCSSFANVSGDNDVGGLVGRNGGEVSNCYGTNTVSGHVAVGGLIGMNWIPWWRGGRLRGRVIQCYSSGAVSGSEDVGGLVGDNRDSSEKLTSSFWDTQTSGQAVSAGGTGKTTAEMQTAQTFLDAGWDFVDETINGTEDIWKIAEGRGYPRLSWEKYSGGTGEPNDPYQIATAADLIALGETPEDYDKHFILTADIDLDPNLPGRKVFYSAVIAPHMGKTYSFEGIPFSGVFDGRGHKISNLTIKGVVYLGLFGVLGSQAEVKDLGMVNVNIFRPSSMTGAGDYVGGLAGHNTGSVRYCYVTGTVSGNIFIGGLVGNNSGSVAQCYSTVVLDGDSVAGGLVGSNGGNVIYCYSTGAVIGKARLGGLVGANWGAVAQCYSTAVVNGASNVGGLVGRSGLTIMYGDPRMLSLETHAAMSCFWDTDTSGQINSAGGTGKSTIEMHDIKTYLDAGWDFIGESSNGTSEIWHMPENGGYPVLAVLNGYTPLRLQGAGTPEKPYLISNAFELGNVVHYSPQAHYRLASSIDLDGISWGGAVIPWFTGTFDGNAHCISHLTIRGGSRIGLFGYLAAGVKVEDLGVVDVNIISLDFVVHAGGLAGCNEGTVIQCYSTGTLTGAFCVGGLVGSNPGTLIDCYSSAMVKGTSDVGGLTGRNCSVYNWNGVITRCYSTGTVTGDRYFGGLMGYCDWDRESTSSSFWDIESSGQSISAGGTGKTTVRMQEARTFLDAGWDFVDETENGTDDIWWILEGQDYPRLWWETADEQR